MEPAVDSMGAILDRMFDAWNCGDASAFAANFVDDVRFIAFDGTVLYGHDEVVDFHQPLFDTVLKGSRLVHGEMIFTHVFGDGYGAFHHRLRVVMPGEEKPLPSRDSMQLVVVRWTGGRWQVVALQNSRVISLERQLALDAMEGA